MRGKRAAFVGRLWTAIAATGAALLLACAGNEPSGELPRWRQSATGIKLGYLWKSPAPDSQTVLLVRSGQPVPAQVSAAIDYAGGDTGWLSVRGRQRGDTAWEFVTKLVGPQRGPGACSASVNISSDGGSQPIASYRVRFVVAPTAMRVKVLPVLPGFGSQVDAVTQASDVASSVNVNIEPFIDSTDSAKDVIVDFGDGEQAQWLNGRFPGYGFDVSAPHWYVRVHPSGICTTTVRAVSCRGFPFDTTILVKVLAKDAHR